MLKTLVTLLIGIILFIGISASLLDYRYGGGDIFPDRTSAPLLPNEALEVVANLPYPPGNVAVSSNNRLFFSYHPEGKPPSHVMEWVNNTAVEFPQSIPNELALQSVLSIRIDQQNRLWILDYANHGLGQPRLIAIDLNSEKVVHHYDFSSSEAGIGSNLNDFQVSSDGNTIYIADASFFAKKPAILIYNITNQTVKRVLERHDSVNPDHYIPVVEGTKMLIAGVIAVRPGVDSIALSRDGDWLYYAPITDNFMYRIATRHLNNPALSPTELEQKVEEYALKTMSDGITTDDIGNIYISDLEHSSILRLSPDKQLETLVKTKKLRWPDGFSFGPNGWLYVTASALQDVMIKPRDYISKKGPYQIFRIKLDASATPGH